MVSDLRCTAQTLLFARAGWSWRMRCTGHRPPRCWPLSLRSLGHVPGASEFISTTFLTVCRGLCVSEAGCCTDTSCPIHCARAYRMRSHPGPEVFFVCQAVLDHRRTPTLPEWCEVLNQAVDVLFESSSGKSKTFFFLDIYGLGVRPSHAVLFLCFAFVFFPPASGTREETSAVKVL